MRAPVSFASTLVASLLAASSAARADEPVAAREPRLMQETGENTTVIDAFDKDDPFDANFLLTFRQSWKNASIRRETALNQPGLSTGNFVPANENIASYSRATSILELGADVGIFRDLALSFRLPFVLSDSQELSDLDGSSRNPQRLQDPADPTKQLFTVPFKSPTRSGIDYLQFGIDYAILNQARDDTKPTWVVGLETRVSIGERLHACNDNPPPGAVRCPDPANPQLSRDPGISRGMTGLTARTVFSRRFGYVEPYAGFRFMFEFPQGNSDYGATNDVRGTLLSHPPAVGTFMMGLEIIPMENREQFQRLVLDFRLRGDYHSPGREYSELFDALGSSQAPSLRSGNPTAYKAGADGFTSVVDQNAGKVFFSGITDQQPYGSFGGHVAVTYQTAKWIKFTGGVGLTYSQPHLVTAADACNPDISGGAGSSGPCRVGGASAAGGSPTGIPNPNHRPVIDLPGRRFSVDDTTVVDFFLSGIVMF